MPVSEYVLCKRGKNGPTFCPLRGNRYRVVGSQGEPTGILTARAAHARRQRRKVGTCAAPTTTGEKLKVTVVRLGQKTAPVDDMEVFRVMVGGDYDGWIRHKTTVCNALHPPRSFEVGKVVTCYACMKQFRAEKAEPMQVAVDIDGWVRCPYKTRGVDCGKWHAPDSFDLGKPMNCRDCGKEFIPVKNEAATA